MTFVHCESILLRVFERTGKRGIIEMGVKVAVIFGGQSTEHDVSCVSAATVIRNMDPGYEQVLIGITKEGRWLLVDNVEEIENGSWTHSKRTAVFSPDATRKEVLIETSDGRYESIDVDVVFPVLHGMYGEDGTIQGLFEMSGIPYVGCGVLASAISMDKLYTKIVVQRLGIDQAAYQEVRDYQLKQDGEAVMDRIEKNLPYPVFVKPSKAGSSVGVSRASDRSELKAALDKAAGVDDEILVEEAIDGREIECGVLGRTDDVKSSCVGEVVADSRAAFYDYDAKYNSAESKTVIDPELPDGKSEEIRRDARAIFQAVNGFGLARVDFFLERGTDRVVFNELNTMPGFTSISMYPMLWKASGLSVHDLIDRLIDMAMTRREDA